MQKGLTSGLSIWNSRSQCSRVSSGLKYSFVCLQWFLRKSSSIAGLAVESNMVKVLSLI